MALKEEGRPTAVTVGTARQETWQHGRTVPNPRATAHLSTETAATAESRSRTTLAEFLARILVAVAALYLAAHLAIHLVAAATTITGVLIASALMLACLLVVLVALPSKARRP